MGAIFLPYGRILNAVLFSVAGLPIFLEFVLTVFSDVLPYRNLRRFVRKTIMFIYIVTGIPANAFYIWITKAYQIEEQLPFVPMVVLSYFIYFLSLDQVIHVIQYS